MPTDRRFEPWPFAVAGLLAAMIAGSLAFAVVASRNPDPPVVTDSWSAGRAYSENVRAARRIEALGWRVDLATAPAPGGVDVRVGLHDAAGQPLAPGRVEVRRERPAEGGLDAGFELRRAEAGFAGHVPLPRPGRWRLVVRVEAGEEAVEQVFGVAAP
jgi:nitrogen fixation protein FixH